jgi:predicted transcriptional regulator
VNRSATTSVRLNPDLRSQLERVSHKLHRGKSWIINQALKEYLTRIENPLLKEEARRQSLLASQHDDESWDEINDETDWE